MKKTTLIFSILLMFFSCDKDSDPDDLSEDLTCEGCNIEISKASQVKQNAQSLNLTSRRAIRKKKSTRRNMKLDELEKISIIKDKSKKEIQPLKQ